MSADSNFLNVLWRTRQVADYQADSSTSRRPVLLASAGAFLALVSAALCGLLAKQIWLDHDVAPGSGLFGVSLLFVFYVVGVYCFALAYELYDVEKALRLTFIMAVLGVLALGFMVIVFVALFWLKTGAGVVLSERQQNTLLGAVSHLGSEDEDETPRRNPLDFLVGCKNCEMDFIPVPPDAMCPWCDTPYFGTTAAAKSA